MLSPSDGHAFWQTSLEDATPETLMRALLEVTIPDYDWDGDDVKDTPRRFVKMIRELTDASENWKFTTFESDSHEMVIVKNIRFVSLCVGPRSRIHTTNRGTIRIHEVQEGESIWTSVGGELVPTNVVRKSISKKYERVTIRGGKQKGKLSGFELQLSIDHPVLTQRGWILAGQLQEGDCVPRHNSRQFHRKKITITTGYSLGYVLGAISADGFIEDQIHKRRVNLTVREEWFARRYARHVQEALGLHPEVKFSMQAGGFIKEPRPTWTVQFFEVDAIDKLIRLLGGKKRWNTVRLPDIVRSDAQIMQGYLDGYHDGDGTFTYKEDREYKKICSNNPSILQDLHEAGVAGKPYMDANSGEGSVMLLKKPKFSPVEDVTVDLDSWATELIPIDEVEYEKISNTSKPFSFYELECDPYPSFIVNSVPTHNCSHHLAPFTGLCHVGYIPDGKIAGLSKIARQVQTSVRTPSVQEELTTIIADTFDDILDPQGVIVIMRAHHSCMSLRGVLAHEAETITSAVRGVFFDNEHGSKEEFMRLIGLT